MCNHNVTCWLSGEIGRINKEQRKSGYVQIIIEIYYQLSFNWWFGLVVWWLSKGFPFILSTNQSKPPTKVA